MLGVKIICVGKIKENFYIDAMGEYTKRLGAYCNLDVMELPEQKLQDKPSGAQINAALKKEAKSIEKLLTGSDYVTAMCIEGKLMSSEELAGKMRSIAVSGSSRVVFIIGGSFGMDETIKKRADLKLSISRMTFPHHLARVILAEQVYRAFQINSGGKYHK